MFGKYSEYYSVQLKDNVPNEALFDAFADYVNTHPQHAQFADAASDATAGMIIPIIGVLILADNGIPIPPFSVEWGRVVEEETNRMSKGSYAHYYSNTMGLAVNYATFVSGIINTKADTSYSFILVDVQEKVIPKETLRSALSKIGSYLDQYLKAG